MYGVYSSSLSLSFTFSFHNSPFHSRLDPQLQPVHPPLALSRAFESYLADKLSPISFYPRGFESATVYQKEICLRPRYDSAHPPQTVALRCTANINSMTNTGLRSSTEGNSYERRCPQAELCTRTELGSTSVSPFSLAISLQSLSIDTQESSTEREQLVGEHGVNEDMGICTQSQTTDQCPVVGDQFVESSDQVSVGIRG